MRALSPGWRSPHVDLGAKGTASSTLSERGTATWAHSGRDSGAVGPAILRGGGSSAGEGCPAGGVARGQVGLRFSAWRCLTRRRRPRTVGPMPPAPELRPAVDALLAEFLRHLALERGRSAHTVRAYRADLAPLLAGLDDVAALDLAALRRWLAAGHAARASRSTLARRAAAARTFTGWAHRTGHLPSDPGVRLVSPRPRRRPADRARPRSRPPPSSTPQAPAPRRASRWRCATSRCSSCSTPPVCGWPSCAGSTSTTSTAAALAARARQGRPGAHRRLRRPRRGGAGPLARGRPSSARQARLAARPAAGSPREAPGPAGGAQRRAPCGHRRARRSGRRARTVSDTPPQRT